MAKHLEARSKQTVKKQNDILPKLIKLKKPPRRRFHYERAFSTMEMIPILAAVILFITTCLAPIGHRFKLLAYGITALVAGFSILRHAFERILRLRLPDEDCLILLAALAAFAAREPAAAALIVILGQLARLVSAYAIVRSARSVDFLRDILPETAHVEEEHGTMDIVPEEVVKGDILLVKQNEAFPVDAVILDGAGPIDTSVFNGSETTRPVGAGDEVMSGCINRGEELRVKALRSFEDSSMARHLQSLSETEKKKTRLEDKIEFYSTFFAPAFLCLAVIFGLIVPLFSHAWRPAFQKADILLLLASPASLLLSIPVAYLGAMTRASRGGILIKSKTVLEKLSHTKTLIFGKTGTITDGNYTISDVVANRVKEKDLLAVAAAAESSSRHPIALAIKQAAGWTAEDSEKVLEIEEIPGRGVTAFIDGKHVYVGNAALLEEHGIWFQVPSRSGAAVHVAVENEYWGHILLADKIREGAFDAIEELRSEGVDDIVMLTGDVRSVTAPLARSLNFDMVKTELSTEDKLSAVSFLRKGLGKGESLAYVGDGFHDSALFESADVGIALDAMGMNESTSAASVLLIDEDILRVPDALRIAVRSDRIIKENLILAAAMKLVLLVLALCGVLPILTASIVDTLASCLVSLNALRCFMIQ